MTDTTTEAATDRFVYAPDGKVWVEAAGEIPGGWCSEEEVPPGHHRAVEVDGPDRHVRVPADEPASKADLMQVAGELMQVQEDLMVLTTRLEGAAALLNLRNGIDQEGER